MKRANHPETMAQAMRKAKRAKPPPARFAMWLDKMGSCRVPPRDKMGSCRVPPRDKAAAVQRRYDARMVARMRKIIARHNRAALRAARAA